jgi:hypothetical protein
MACTRAFSTWAAHEQALALAGKESLAISKAAQYASSGNMLLRMSKALCAVCNEQKIP